MKTNRYQVRRNCNASAAAQQCKTNPQNAVTVIFYSPDDDKELFRVDFPERLFASISAGAKKLGVSLDKFFELAIVNKIGNNECALPRGDVHPSCLCIFDRSTQQPASKIPLSEQEFCKCIIAPHLISSEFQGMTTQELIAQAIREKINKGKKVHKNFFLVNMSQHDQKELRTLAAAFGIELRLFLSHAVRHAKRELEQALAVAKGARLDPQFVYCLIAGGTTNN
jgi:hypothetical protein